MGRFSLNGVALVTGAASGIGRECAKSFIREGCSAVVVADLHLERVEEIAKEATSSGAGSGCKVLPLEVDISDSASVAAMVAKTVEAFGRIDYCVNTAGLGNKKAYLVQEMTADELDLYHNVHVRGAFNIIHSVSRQMLDQEPRPELTVDGRNVERGSIVNLSSVSAFTTTHGLTPYATSKHAVVGLTINSALDLAKHGIRVNAVCPGWIETPMVSGAMDPNFDVKEYLRKSVPLGRFGTVQEVADVTLFLASPTASFVTGAGWVIDGGLSLYFPSPFTSEA